MKVTVQEQAYTVAVAVESRNALFLRGQRLGDLSTVADAQVLRYDAGSAAWIPGDVTVSAITDAQVAAGAAIAWTKISKTGSSLADLATRSAADLSSGTLLDARVAASNVTQHQAALTILESQISDGTVYARLAANEQIGGSWTFDLAPKFSHLTPGSIVFAGALGVVSQDNGSLFWDAALKCFGIGTATPTSSLQLGGVALPGDAVDKNWLNITGAFPTTNTAQLQGVRINIASAGSVDQRQRAVDVALSVGYTGPNMTVALGGSNTAAGTATAGWTGANANYGGYWTAGGTGAGHNVAMQASSSGSSVLNLASFGRSTSSTNTPALNVGVAGHALNGTVNVAGYFGLRNAAPTLTSAALIADNGAEAAPIFLARDNGTDVFTIADGGMVTAAGGFEMRNGTTDQTAYIYRTFTSATSFERAELGVWSGSRFSIKVMKGAGGGAYRDIDIQNNDSVGYRFTTTYGFQIVGPTGTLGYATGSGGAVAQATSKSTGVTLNKGTGQITMHNAALAAGAKVSFVVSNSLVAAVDGVVPWVASGGTANAYRVDLTAVGAGTFTLTIENITAGSLSEAPVIGFAVIKGATS